MTIAKNSNLIPSVCKIFFALLDNVDSITLAADRFHRNIVFKDNPLAHTPPSPHTWQQIYFTVGTAEFTEKPKESDAGELIEQSIKFIFPGDDDTNLLSLDAIIGRPVMVKIEFSGEVSKLMGDLDNGAKLSQIYQISSKGTGSQLEFSCMATYRACWISA